MSGFPARLVRSSFGPELEDEGIVKNPRTQIPASAFNDVFGQIAGLNVATLARAVLVAEWDSGTSGFVIRYQAEAWNSESVQAHPTLTRVDAGAYQLTFASTYKDNAGADIPTVLLAARASALVAATSWTDVRLATATINAANPLVVDVMIWNPSGTPALADAPFWLEVA